MIYKFIWITNTLLRACYFITMLLLGGENPIIGSNGTFFHIPYRRKWCFTNTRSCDVNRWQAKLEWDAYIFMKSAIINRYMLFLCNASLNASILKPMLTYTYLELNNFESFINTTIRVFTLGVWEKKYM